MNEQSSSEIAATEPARRGHAPLVPRLAAAVLLGGIAWLATPAIAGAACATPGNATTACSGNCAAISVGSMQAQPGSTVQIPISFTQGPNDNQPMLGFDEVAALAFTLGIPGTADGATPLTFNCLSGNCSVTTATKCTADSDCPTGEMCAGGAVTPGAGDFTVVVENAQCTNRNRCLCPDTTVGQTRDNFVNIVVYGPKNLPPQGPVTIPVLPSGTLVTLSMQVASDAPASIPLHVFSALDTAPVSKPQFAANLSIGDESACDVTATGTLSNVSFSDGVVSKNPVPTSTNTPPVSTTPTPPTTPGRTPGSCVGDCSGDGHVTINELVVGVNIALGTADASTCVAFQDQSGMVPITQLIKGVNNALNGC